MQALLYDQVSNAEVVDFVCCSSVHSLDYRCISVGDILPVV